MVYSVHMYVISTKSGAYGLLCENVGSKAK